MATYTVIQDIEAEDKFVGPLTLKQFVFAMIGCFFAWVCFFFVTSGLTWGLIISLPISLFGFFMAVPWSKDQPTDVWVLAKIRFMIKPKKRLWNQAGRQELVTITAPKKIEKHLTKDFSNTEVKSRLKALAETIDSRGWAVKHIAAGAVSGGSVAMDSNDRLFDARAILPQQVPDEDFGMPDIMENSAMDEMIQDNDTRRRSEIANNMDRARQNDDNQNFGQSSPIVPPPDDDPSAAPPKNAADRIDEMLLSDQIKARKVASGAAYKHMSVVAPTKKTPPPKTQNDDVTDGEQDENGQPKIIKKGQPKTENKKTTSTMTEQVSPDIINLARNNDLNVSTIARQANNDKSDDDNEVVISLH